MISFPLLSFPKLKGTLETSAVTGRLEPTYPRWKRNMFRYFVSVPIIAACLFFVFIVMILSFQIQVRDIFCTFRWTKTYWIWNTWLNTWFIRPIICLSGVLIQNKTLKENAEVYDKIDLNRSKFVTHTLMFS